MKNFINTLYEGLITWTNAIAKYRQSNASKYYYWGDIMDFVSIQIAAVALLIIGHMSQEFLWDS